MPKIKSNKGACKRFKHTGSDKHPFKCKSSHRNHILTKKSTKRKRHLRNDACIKKCDVKEIKRMVI